VAGPGVDEIADDVADLPEERREPRGEVRRVQRRMGRARRRVRRQVHVQPAVRERRQPRARPRPPHLDRVRPTGPVRHDAPPTGVARVLAGDRVPVQPRAQLGPDAVAADDRVVRLHPTVRRLDEHVAAAVLDPRGRGGSVDRCAEVRHQEVVQVRPRERERASVTHGRGPGQRTTRRVHEGDPRHFVALPPERRFEAERVEAGQGVRSEHDARADGPWLGRPLDQPDRNPAPNQGAGEYQAADAGADDEDTLHGNPRGSGARRNRVRASSSVSWSSIVPSRPDRPPWLHSR
jgi:hypothetical protein